MTKLITLALVTFSLGAFAKTATIELDAKVLKSAESVVSLLTKILDDRIIDGIHGTCSLKTTIARVLSPRADVDSVGTIWVMITVQKSGTIRCPDYETNRLEELRKMD